MFALVHGLPKVLGGVSLWIKLGGAFNRLIGVDFVPAFWGFIATVAEFGGGLCLVLGLFFRPACGLMVFTLTIAAFSILCGGYGFAAASQPIELGVVLFSLLFTGPGRFTFSHAITTIRSRS
ncbi:MAG: DoxX family membrane protein [Chthoniobacterales bacterium]|nr:DoxX family membrane protein [Chthoniobacterales bacterium]